MWNSTLLRSCNPEKNLHQNRRKQFKKCARWGDVSLSDVGLKTGPTNRRNEVVMGSSKNQETGQRTLARRTLSIPRYDVGSWKRRREGTVCPNVMWARVLRSITSFHNALEDQTVWRIATSCRQITTGISRICPGITQRNGTTLATSNFNLLSW